MGSVSAAPHLNEALSKLGEIAIITFDFELFIVGLKDGP
jgi:hypothetical protein